jgi:hypothetical protein
MVELVRQGRSARGVAKQYRVALSTVQFWVKRARGRRLDRVDFSDRPSGCRRAHNRCSARTERTILKLRRQLREQSVLGECGAEAIRREMVSAVSAAPSVRTIGRILQRHGQVDGRRRVRRPPPPKGWYLPDVAASKVELDSFDVVEGLKIKDGPIVEVLNGVSLHGGLVASWPVRTVTAKFVVQCLERHWRRFGLPAYAQFDNGTVFQGAHHWPDSLGRVVRMCLGLGVTPVFAPPREHGVQNLTESYNNLWEAKVWRRFDHESLNDLRVRSNAYVLARRERTAAACDAVERAAFPSSWRLDLDRPLRGKVCFLRRTSESGSVSILQRTFQVDRDWPHRLVRAELDLDADLIHFYRLRKADPTDQPLLKKVPYAFPRKPFTH